MIKENTRMNTLTKNQSEYELMLYDTKVATINIEDGEVLIDSNLPIGLSLISEPHTVKDAVKNIFAFQDWCSSRILMMSQKHAKKICNALAISQDLSTESKAKIALTYHCSTLNDNYWVRKQGENISFQEVSLFYNTSQNILTPVSLKGKTSSLFREKLKNWSDLGVDGILAKSWVRDGKEYYLYKECDNAEGEVLAAQILSALNVSHVDYELVQDDITMTKCKCFTDDTVGFVPYRTWLKEYGTDSLELIKENFLQGYANLAVCTYLIGNEDLHDKNWGILIDQTGNAKGLSPMFDFDGCFLSYRASADAPFLPECRFIDEDGKEFLYYDFDIDSCYTLSGPTIKEVAIRYAKESTVDFSDFDFSIVPEKFRSEFQKRAYEIIEEQKKQKE